MDYLKNRLNDEAFEKCLSNTIDEFCRNGYKKWKESNYFIK